MSRCETLGHVDEPCLKCGLCGSCLIEMTNERDAALARIKKLECERDDTKYLIDAEESDRRLMQHPKSDAMMRETLGSEMFNRLWGPGLEALGKVVDVALNREAEALARVERTEKALQALADQRDALAYRKLRGEELSPRESLLLEVLNEHVQSLLPVASALPEEARSAIQEMRNSRAR